MTGFRPKQILTLGQLVDFANHLLTNGIPTSTRVYLDCVSTRNAGDGLSHLTLCTYAEDGPEAPAFVVFDYWTDDQLAKSAAHCDKLGIPRE